MVHAILCDVSKVNKTNSVDPWGMMLLTVDDTWMTVHTICSNNTDLGKYSIH